MTRIDIPLHMICGHAFTYSDYLRDLISKAAAGAAFASRASWAAFPGKRDRVDLWRDYFGLFEEFYEEGFDLATAEPPELCELLEASDAFFKAGRAGGIWFRRRVEGFFKAYVSYSFFRGGRIPSLEPTFDGHRLVWRLGFRRNPSKWRGRALALGLNDVDVCPYCNVARLPKRVVRKKTRLMQEVPDLDHTFNKDVYPYLALSLFNLVPACSDCNRRIKECRTLDYRQHAHPYADDVHAHVRFRLPDDYVQVAAGRPVAPVPRAIELDLRTPQADRRALNLMSFFDIEGQSQLGSQRRKAANVARTVIHGQSFEEYQRTSLGKGQLSRAEYEQVVYESELRPDAINKYENGKLILDVYEQCLEIRQKGTRD